MTQDTARERAVLDALHALGGWTDVSTVTRIAKRTPGLTFAPGTTRAILDRLTDAGRCERQRQGGTAATFRPKTLHIPRTGWRGRAGETMGFYSLCSCGWGWSEPLHGTEDEAMAAAKAHAEGPDA
jgi:hypothetical protein